MIMSINIAMPGKSCWVALCKPFEPSSVPNLREDLDHVEVRRVLYILVMLVILVSTGGGVPKLTNTRWGPLGGGC